MTQRFIHLGLLALVLGFTFASPGATQAAEVQPLRFECTPIPHLNELRVSGTLQVKGSDSSGRILAAGEISLTLQRRQTHPVPREIGPLAFEGFILEHPGLEDAQGNPVLLHVLRIPAAGLQSDEVEYINLVFSSDHSRLGSWVRGTDGARYFAHCTLH